MTRVVVTGGSGKGGRAVVRDLVDHGFDVVNVDLQPPTVEVAPLLRAELTDLGETIEAIRGADAVVHLAAVPAPRIRTVERTFEINVLSTYNVFTAATLLRVQRVVWGVERDRPRTAPSVGGTLAICWTRLRCPAITPSQTTFRSTKSIRSARTRAIRCPKSTAKRWRGSSRGGPASRSSAFASRRSARPPSTPRSPTRGAIRT